MEHGAAARTFVTPRIHATYSTYWAHRPSSRGLHLSGSVSSPPDLDSGRSTVRFWDLQSAVHGAARPDSRAGRDLRSRLHQRLAFPPVRRPRSLDASTACLQSSPPVATERTWASTAS
ncbi:hypothetical protein NDU88_005253 [Pleurodeles waltl]|uniref:Uncharacterized protein n=1 Tax=Pleurodeles waltl TaxID=8319 RepID=A0AAV7NLV0_PLEWA|nr:hypothetical protein NDU88_005253 [Pleurodeles waltl]